MLNDMDEQYSQMKRKTYQMRRRANSNPNSPRKPQEEFNAKIQGISKEKDCFQMKKRISPIKE